MSENSDRKHLINRSLLNSERIKVKSSNGDLVFKVPEEIEEQLLKAIGFSFDNLRVGSGASLGALAAHINEHPVQEAYIGAETEKVRYALEIARTSMRIWEERSHHRMRKVLVDQGISKPTEKQISQAVFSNSKMRDEFLQIDKCLKSLEYKYRLLNNVVRSALETKGVLLPTLRNLIQGKNPNMDGVELDREEAIKIRLGDS